MAELKSKYIEARYIPNADEKKKTLQFAIVNKKSLMDIGYVYWYNSWRQYCFFPCNETVFHSGCLFDIQMFITDLMRERKEKQ